MAICSGPDDGLFKLNGTIQVVMIMLKEH